MNRCKLEGKIELKNGRYKIFNGEIPLMDDIKLYGCNVLDLSEFYKENSNINKRLLKNINGKCFDIETNMEVRCVLL